MVFGHAGCFEGQLYTPVSFVMEFMVVFSVNVQDVGE